MSAEKLYEAIGEINERYIEESESLKADEEPDGAEGLSKGQGDKADDPVAGPQLHTTKKSPKRNPWYRALAMAACLVLVVGSAYALKRAGLFPGNQPGGTSQEGGIVTTGDAISEEEIEEAVEESMAAEVDPEETAAEESMEIEESATTANSELPETGAETEDKSVDKGIWHKVTSSDGRIKAGGPYGEISINPPEGWEYRIISSDGESLSTGLYGLQLRPEGVEERQISLYYTGSFGVCGTGLKQEKITLAGDEATIGTYDENPGWDYIHFEGKNEGVVAGAEVDWQEGTDDTLWAADRKDEIMEIMDTMRIDRNKTEGAAYIFTQAAEVPDIGVYMELSHITPSGATVTFTQYDESNKGELIYGQEFVIEKKKGGTWEKVPYIIDNWGFTEEGYTIPPGGTSVMETNWEWLYGKLSPGTYRISKTILDHLDNGNEKYTIYGQFLIAGE